MVRENNNWPSIQPSPQGRRSCAQIISDRWSFCTVVVLKLSSQTFALLAHLKRCPCLEMCCLAMTTYALVMLFLGYCNKLYVRRPLKSLQKLPMVQKASAKLLTGTGNRKHMIRLSQSFPGYQSGFLSNQSCQLSSFTCSQISEPKPEIRMISQKWFLTISQGQAFVMAKKAGYVYVGVHGRGRHYGILALSTKWILLAQCVYTFPCVKPVSLILWTRMKPAFRYQSHHTHDNIKSTFPPSSPSLGFIFPHGHLFII